MLNSTKTYQCKKCNAVIHHVKRKCAEIDVCKACWIFKRVSVLRLVTIQLIVLIIWSVKLF